jgi:23S rRNA (guanosine2251-2'-O)-methyltransferase
VSGGGGRHVYGTGPVRELLRARPKAVLAVHVDNKRAERAGDDPIAEIHALARAAGVMVDARPRDTLDRMVGADARHQGVVADVGPVEYVDADDLVAAAAAKAEPALIVALDGIEDPRNLGAVMRSAYLLGAHGVVIPADRSAAVTPVVTKASAGASELLAIARANNLARVLGELKEQGLWHVAVHAAPEAKPIAALDLAGPTCLVLGAEGHGLRALVAKQCDFHAVIPMTEAGVGSFNVSVAAAIALYEVRRQRMSRATSR